MSSGFLTFTTASFLLSASAAISTSLVSFSASRIARVYEEPHRLCLGHRLVQQLELLCHRLVYKRLDPRDIAARPIEAGHEAEFDRVVPFANTIGMVEVAALAATAGRSGPASDYRHGGRRTRSAAISWQPIVSPRAQRIEATLRPSARSRFQPGPGEGRATRQASLSGVPVPREPDHRCRGLLRSERRAATQPPHHRSTPGPPAAS